MNICRVVRPIPVGGEVLEEWPEKLQIEYVPGPETTLATLYHN